MVSKFKQPEAFIKDLIEIGFKRHRPIKKEDDFETHFLDLSELKLCTSRFTPFIISKRLSGHDKINTSVFKIVLKEFVESARLVRHGFSVLVVGGEYDQAALPPLEELGDKGATIIGKNEIEQIEKATDKESKYKVIGSCLKAYLGLRALSPYVRYRPAVAGRFFGRRQTLTRILAGKQGSNYTFIGNRRIGKTSILREIKDRLEIKYKVNENIRFADIYGANCDNALDVIHGISSALDLGSYAYQLEKDPSKIKQFPKKIREIPDKSNMAVAVFIDELDNILEFDRQGGQKYRLMNLLREAFEHESCQIFFAGFRRVIAASYDKDHPLWNFTKKEMLSRFQREETVEMVTLPLTRLGIDIDNSTAISIYRETGGHPELVQMFCEIIIDNVESRGTLPNSTELLMQVFNEEEMERTVSRTFIANTDPYERLLCYLLVKGAINCTGLHEFEFTEKEALKLISNQDIGVDSKWLSNIIYNLYMSAIILKVPGTQRWKFAVPLLVRYWANRDIESLIEIAREEAKKTPRESILDWPKENKSVKTVY